MQHFKNYNSMISIRSKQKLYILHSTLVAFYKQQMVIRGRSCNCYRGQDSSMQHSGAEEEEAEITVADTRLHLSYIKAPHNPKL